MEPHIPLKNIDASLHFWDKSFFGWFLRILCYIQFAIILFRIFASTHMQYL